MSHLIIKELQICFYISFFICKLIEPIGSLNEFVMEITVDYRIAYFLSLEQILDPLLQELKNIHDFMLTSLNQFLDLRQTQTINLSFIL